MALRESPKSRSHAREALTEVAIRLEFQSGSGAGKLHRALRSVKITRVFTQPDPSKVREFADDVRDGKFVLPIGHRMPLRDATEAHVLGEKGGIGKILLLAPDSQH
jgi:hypothetical protein